MRRSSGPRRAVAALALLLALGTPIAGDAVAQGLTRIKEIARVEGTSSASTVGYGLIVGLDGTGDGKGTLFTVQSVANLLQNMGLTVDSKAVKVKNVAAVMVTADVSPFARSGSAIDVTVSSLGDASSLQGGTLLRTPLEDGRGEVVGFAQGSVSIGGYNIQTGSGTSTRKNHATVGRIPGALNVERVPAANALSDSTLTLVLREPDITSAHLVAEAISKRFGAGTAVALDPQVVQLAVPESFRRPGGVIGFLSDVESVEVPVDVVARVVLNERTGTIVVGGGVRILPVAISHGSLSIKIRSSPVISQPSSFGPENAETVVVSEDEVSAGEEGGDLVLLEGGTSVAELAGALNALGVTPRDMIAILQALRTAGALQAEIVIQ